MQRIIIAPAALCCCLVVLAAGMAAQSSHAAAGTVARGGQAPADDQSDQSSESTSPSLAVVNEPDPACIADKLGKGVYPASNPIDAGKGRLDFDLGNADASALVGIKVGALFCGSDPTAQNSKGLYFESVTVTFSIKRLTVRCARPNPSISAYCKKSNGDIGDGSYMGSSVTNYYCTDFDQCFGGYELNDITAAIHVRYDTAVEGNDTNHCDPNNRTLIACYRSTTGNLTVLEKVACGSDIVVSRLSAKTAAMTLYQPTCTYKGKALDAVYVTAIRPLAFCRYAGGPDDKTCNDTPNPNWLNRVGPKGPGQFRLAARLSDGSTQSAVSS